MAKNAYKYTPEVIVKTEKYLEGCGLQQMEIPTVEGLALELRVDDDTLNVWSKKYKGTFGVLFNRLKMAQKVLLINGGAFGGKEVNASMFIFLLKANHGLSETSKLDVTSGGKPIPILGGNGISNNHGDKKAPKAK